MPKTFNVYITHHARQDLEEIYAYIAADSSAHAVRFIGEIEKQTLSLSTMPDRVALIPENAFFGTRFRHLLYKKYRIIFRLHQHSIFVLRVIHGTRLLEI